MALESPVFQAYQGTEPPRFASQAELECAKVLDYYGIPWLYEPRTFVLEEDEDGRVREAFAPDHFNYAFLQNQDRHVHLHVIPRYQSPRWLAGTEFKDADYPDHYRVPGAQLMADKATLDAIEDALASG